MSVNSRNGLPCSADSELRDGGRPRSSRYDLSIKKKRSYEGMYEGLFLILTDVLLCFIRTFDFHRALLSYSTVFSDFVGLSTITNVDAINMRVMHMSVMMSSRRTGDSCTCIRPRPCTYIDVHVDMSYDYDQGARGIPRC